MNANISTPIPANDSSLSRRGFITVASATAAALAGLSLYGCAQPSNNAGENSIASQEHNSNATFQFDGMSLPPSVHAEMLQPDYWLSKVDSPQKTLLTPQEIALMNKYAFETKPPLIFSLASYQNPLDGAMVASQITQFDDIEDPLVSSGVEITNQSWNDLLNQRNLEAIGASIQPRYGVATTRGDMRLWPTDNFEDQAQQSGILPGEPLVILHENADKSWFFVSTSFCVGWIQASSIAVFSSFDEWLSTTSSDDFYVCLCDETVDALNVNDAQPFKLDLYLGAKLLRATVDEWNNAHPSRSAMGKYTIKRLTRGADGSCIPELLCIPASSHISRGYLPYTTENVLKAAFTMLGDTYQWGGWKKGRDCSQFTMEIYQCFGILLPRDSSPQAQMPFQRKVFDEHAADSEKETLLRKTRPGSILEFPGHAMLYLGEEDGHFYVISDAGTFAQSPNEEMQDLSCVLVNTLDVVRANGKTWMQSLRTIVCVLPE